MLQLASGASLLLLAIGFGLGWWARSPRAQDAALQHARAAVVATTATRDSLVPHVQAAARADSQATAKADTLRRQVVIIDDTTLQVQAMATEPPQRMTVSPLIVGRIASLEAEVGAKARRIQQLEALVAADAGVIGTLQLENDLLKDRQAPRCGAKCGGVIGAAGVAVLVALLSGVAP